MIFSVFTAIEAKRSNTKMTHYKKKFRPRQSSGSSVGRSSQPSSNYGRSSSFGGSSLSHSANQGTQRSSFNTDPAPQSKYMKKKEELPKKPVSQMSVASGPKYDHSKPTGVTYGPRGGPRGGVVGGPGRYFGGRPRSYGYYRGGFPVWLTSYAVVMNNLEECPPTNDFLEFAQKSYGVCLMVCDKLHCIQTMNYCCYYVEQAKYMVVSAK